MGLITFIVMLRYGTFSCTSTLDDDDDDDGGGGGGDDDDDDDDDDVDVEVVVEVDDDVGSETKILFLVLFNSP